MPQKQLPQLPTNPQMLRKSLAFRLSRSVVVLNSVRSMSKQSYDSKGPKPWDASGQLHAARCLRSVITSAATSRVLFKTSLFYPE
ncbi:hypothetical protein Q31b_18300 [Novipirellula aureliae]|uniref:Uncharacterized protein n=1 Tax=Novipirellula aureliae TaxID=2527966 RepID=A0A5C6E6S7_9BACT|nr:hypothetical protein Q31b_18300 [Novipirellula aureliae]